MERSPIAVQTEARCRYISSLVPWHNDSDTDKIKYLTLTDVGKVWQPDSFFRNEKIGNFHDILAPNLYVRIHPNGDVLYSIRLV